MSKNLDLWQDLNMGNAVWRHSGDCRAPHVQLRSGLHSDGFIDLLRYLSDTRGLQHAARILARDFLRPVIANPVHWVVGSPMAAIPFATLVATNLDSIRIGFTEKVGEKDLVCRFDIRPGSRVLQIEEMSTTGGTPQRSIDAVLDRNPDVEIVPYVGAFLTRDARNAPKLTSAKFMSAIDLAELGITFGEWEPDECPLCKGGSRAITNAKKVWPGLLQTMDDPRHQILGAEFAAP